LNFNALTAVLSFVGGKNIVVPSERATVPEAAGICAKAGLELMSLDSITQLDSVQDFLGDIGKFVCYRKNYKLFFMKFEYFLLLRALS
jgi:hypothetical protein